MNAIRTRTLIEKADIVIVRFGEKYKQWNAAFDAGYSAALGKSLIVMHGPDHQHALKEVDAAALAVAETPQQIVDILRYVIKGRPECLESGGGIALPLARNVRGSALKQRRVDADSSPANKRPFPGQAQARSGTFPNAGLRVWRDPRVCNAALTCRIAHGKRHPFPTTVMLALDASIPGRPAP